MIKIHKYFLLFILFKISLIFAQYINPPARYAHKSALIGSNLYFIGGYDVKDLPRADFFYLDLSIPFTTTSPLPFVSINNNGLTPSTRCTIATIKDKIYLLGGYMIDESSLVYQYDVNSNQWMKPSIAGTSPVRRWYNDAVVDPSTEKIYYFGGYINGDRIFNDTWILNTNNNQLSWQQITPNNVLSFPTYAFTATLLTDGNILCIGGLKNPGSYTNMNNINRYNTKSNSWDIVQTQGYLPGIRGGHSAVLVPDGRIIVYGGRIVTSAIFPPTEDLIVLDTTKFPYEWVLPKQVENKPVIRALHTAHLYENYMIVAFGILTDETLTSEILLLDVTDKLNYKWINNFKNFSIIPPTATAVTDSNNDVGVIIGSTIGSIVGIALISVAIFFGYKFYKKRDIIKIAGGNRA